MVFAAASEQLVQRQADVDHMQAIVDDLIKQLKVQEILFAETGQKVTEIKAELSRILQNAHDT